MLSRKALALASLCTIVCVASGAAAEDFKSAKFLTYPADAQQSYISTAVVAATIVVSLNSKEQAGCLGKWLETHQRASFASVLEVMRKYPQDHPAGLVIAVLQ